MFSHNHYNPVYYFISIQNFITHNHNQCSPVFSWSVNWPKFHLHSTKCLELKICKLNTFGPPKLIWYCHDITIAILLLCFLKLDRFVFWKSQFHLLKMTAWTICIPGSIFINFCFTQINMWFLLVTALCSLKDPRFELASRLLRMT